MSTKEIANLYLLDSYANDGYFYIVSKAGILVTEEIEIKISEMVQFAFPEHAERPKIQKGIIIMESGNYINSKNYNYYYIIILNSLT